MMMIARWQESNWLRLDRRRDAASASSALSLVHHAYDARVVIRRTQRASIGDLMHAATLIPIDRMCFRTYVEHVYLRDSDII